jgi:thiamine-monophosphate kinase
MLVEGRHFLPDVDPSALGHKTLAVNLSDMAAMGATPRWALLAGALPDNDERWVAAFAGGLFALAERFGVALIGGDTTRGPRNLCVTIIGEIPVGTAMTRSGAAAGRGCVRIGRAGRCRARARRAFGPHDSGCGCPRHFAGNVWSGPSRASRWASVARGGHRGSDVSDGLTGDLAHILAASSVGADVELARIPRSPLIAQRLATHDARKLALACLLAGGDDYELCFTAPPSARERVAAIARELSLPLTRIGVRHVRHPGCMCATSMALRSHHCPAAFDHFR